MWLWVFLAVVFVFLVVKSLLGSLETTSSRPVAFLAALTDGLAMLAMAAGVFGVLIALVLGVLANHGPRLAGAQLTDMLIWSGGLMLFALLMLVAGSYVRRLGGRPGGQARPLRGSAQAAL